MPDDLDRIPIKGQIFSLEGNVPFLRSELRWAKRDGNAAEIHKKKFHLRATEQAIKNLEFLNDHADLIKASIRKQRFDLKSYLEIEPAKRKKAVTHAAILCNDPDFQAFIRSKTRELQLDIPDLPSDAMKATAVLTRHLTNVKSRSEYAKYAEAYAQWQMLYNDFSKWKSQNGKTVTDKK